MPSQSDTIPIEGYTLHRTTITPPKGVSITAAAFFFHGQGDFCERYPHILKPFTDRGILCIGTDLLGHGRSPGRRGHAGNLELVDAMMRENISQIGNLPYGIIGHSMGGLLALRHYLVASRGEFPLPQFTWASSPLLRPSYSRPRWFVRLVLLLASLLPKVTIATGVTPEMCHSSEPSLDHSAQTDLKYQLGHKRVSLGWAKELIHAAQLVASSLPKSHAPILYTQGAEDNVCPPQFARDFCDAHPNIEYAEFQQARHEPFSDAENDDFYKRIHQWLDDLSDSSEASAECSQRN